MLIWTANVTGGTPIGLSDAFVQALEAREYDPRLLTAPRPSVSTNSEFVRYMTQIRPILSQYEPAAVTAILEHAQGVPHTSTTNVRQVFTEACDANIQLLRERPALPVLGDRHRFIRGESFWRVELILQLDRRCRGTGRGPPAAP